MERQKSLEAKISPILGIGDSRIGCLVVIETLFVHPIDILLNRLETMSLQDLANFSQIVQAILVVVSLGFIWYQLREGVRLAKSENARSLAEQAESFNSIIVQNADLAELWYSYGQRLDQFSDTDRLRYREMLVQNLIFHEYMGYE